MASSSKRPKPPAVATLAAQAGRSRLTRLLLVEDNVDDAFLMTRALGQVGIANESVFHARDGQQALDYLVGRGSYSDRLQFPPPCLVLLDIKLPLISGLEVLQGIQSASLPKKWIIIVLTSSNIASDVTRSYELGAHSYVVKPASLEELSAFAKALKEYWLVWNRFP